ncbi:MAG: DUF4215 domain-containing protein [Myxococcales bacterium]|nr:DUF4215 domain-containing protein [Myxococcales bacterium]
MRIRPHLKVLALVAATAVAACGDDNTIPGTGDDATVDTGGGGNDVDASDTTEEVTPDVPDDVPDDVPGDVPPDGDEVGPDAPIDVPDEEIGPDADVTPDGDVTPDTDVTPDGDVTPDTDVTPDGDVTPDVVEPFCGDGNVDDGEDCDDGNDVDTDECPNDCILSICGDGERGRTEECDDGNDVDTDGCTTRCTLPRCGDGIAATDIDSELFAAPVVTNIGGVTGHVCDDGASCFGTAGGTTCSVIDDGTAPEHGICQALGYAVALDVTWGGGPGDTDAAMPHAYNWECRDYVCIEGDDYATDNCGSAEMLRSITCADGRVEACDAGDSNADVPGATCRTDCTLPRCGDAVLDDDLGEECDDGADNGDGVDGCRDNCRRAFCGDGVTDSGEECDDGDDNGDTADTCRLGCILPACGDGVTDSGEECDDGNDVNDDGCANNCLLPGCGDGNIQPELGEECDDGNDDAEDGCSNNCLTPQCGDGVYQEGLGEECDDGNDNDFDSCRNGCIAPFCGDAVVSVIYSSETFDSPIVTGPTGATGHVCDDGGTCFGTAAGTVCDVSTRGDAPEHGICQALGYQRAVVAVWGGGAGDADLDMPHAYNWTCVDFVCTAGTNDFDTDNCGSTEMLRSITCEGLIEEACDEGDLNEDVLGAPCRTDCTLPRCGDGVYDEDLGEECDDGNTTMDDGCSNNCLRPQCGDGVTQDELGEECDDANDIDTDSCRNDCTLQICGDRFVADDEECDDGDRNSDDPDAACRLDCTFARCGDGIVDSGEECDDGNTSNIDLCTNACADARCGDGYRQYRAGESCDDGNDIDDDECPNTCDGPVLDFVSCADVDLGSEIGDAVSTGTTAGGVSDWSQNCTTFSTNTAPDLSFNWIAPTTGTYVISTDDITDRFDTIIKVHRMAAEPTDDVCASSIFSAELCDDDGSDIGLLSSLTFDAEGGTAYLIVLDGFGAGSGPYVLSINLAP